MYSLVLKYLGHNHRVFLVQIILCPVNHHTIYSVIRKIIHLQSSRIIPAFFQDNHPETLFIIMERFQTKRWYFKITTILTHSYSHSLIKATPIIMEEYSLRKKVKIIQKQIWTKVTINENILTEFRPVKRNIMKMNLNTILNETEKFN